MKLLSRLLLGVAIVLAVLGVAASWMIGTDSGTRWLIARAENMLPDELRLGDAEGSLLRGVRIDSIEWRGEPVRLRVLNLFVDIQLLPLFGRHVVIEELDADQIELAIAGGGEQDRQDEQMTTPAVELPIDLTVASSSLRQILIETGSTSRHIDELVFAGTLRGSRLRISRLRLDSAWLELEAGGRITLADSYAGSLEAGWLWKESAAGPFGGQLRISGDLREYTLHHALTAPVEITTTGTISREAGSLSADLLNEWRVLEWAVEQRTLRSPRGSLRVRGDTAAFSVELDAVAGVDEQPDTRIRLAGDAGPDRIRITSFDAENALGRVTAEGDVRWLPDVFFDLEYTLADLDPGLLSNAISGTVGLEGSVTGTIGDGQPDIDLRIDGIHGEIGGNPVRGAGAIRITGAIFSLTGTRLQVGSNRIGIDGRIGPSLSLGAEIDFADFGEIVPTAAGSLRGRLALRGPRDRPDLQASLNGSQIAWRQYSLESVSFDADFSASEQGNAELLLRGIAIDDLELEEAVLRASGRLPAHELRVTLRALGSEVIAEANGGYDQQAWTGELNSLAVSNDALGRWATRGASRLVAAPGRALLAPTCLLGDGDKGSICLGGAFLAEGPASFDVSISDVPVAAVPVRLPAGIALRGYIDGDVGGEWQDSRLTAEAEIELRDAAVDATYDDEPLSLDVSQAVVRAAVVNNVVESSARIDLSDGAAGGSFEFSMQDLTDMLSPIAGRADVTIADALSIAVMMPGVIDPQGRIDGNLAVGGNLQAPEFVGEITLTDGSLGVRQAGIEVSDVGLRLSQMAPGRLALTGSARSGGGQIEISGQTMISADTGIRSEILISGDNFEVAKLPNWSFSASPSITVIFDERVTSVVGDLEIPRADIRVKEIPESAETPSPDVVVHRPGGTEPSRARRIDVDVSTSLGDDVRLSAFGLTTGLGGAVQIKGGSHEPYTGSGRLTLRDGRYKAYGQELDIERGELLFNGPLDNPQLSVRAVRRIDDIVAGIELSGTPTQLQSSVFSDPSMSDAEVLSYLLTGRPLASATSAGQGDTLNNAAFALGVTGAGSITSQVRTELGLDTLAIEGGVDDSRLIAGKRFGDRLLIEYGYGLIDELGTLLLRYRLSERFTIESRTGTVSNLDILYSVKKK